MRQWPIRSQGCHKAAASAHAPHTSSPFQNADRRTAMPAVPARRSRLRAASLIHDQRTKGEPLVWLCPLLRLFSTALNGARAIRSEEHTSELQSLMRISYAVFCLTKKNTTYIHGGDRPTTHRTNSEI